MPPRVRCHPPRSPVTGALRALAALIALAAIPLAVLTTATVLRHGAAYPVDLDVHRWALSRRAPAAVTIAVAVTTSGAGLPAYVLAAAGGMLAYRRVRWHGALAGVAVLGLGELLRGALVNGIHRHRPPPADWVVTVSGYAMPSGHTTASAITAVVLTVGLARAVRGPARPVLLAIPGLWALSVGASRVYLGVHWLTDVVAGWLLATVWTALLGLLLLATRARQVGH